MYSYLKPVGGACLAAFLAACSAGADLRGAFEKPAPVADKVGGFYPLTTDFLGNVTVVARQHIYPELKTPVMEEFRFADHAHCVRFDGLFNVCKPIEGQSEDIRALYAAEEKKHRFFGLALR